MKTLRIYFFFSSFLSLYLQHMEVPRLRSKSELQLLAYTTATATPDPNPICNLCWSLQQRQILNLPSEARDRSSILMDTSWVLNPLSHNGSSRIYSFNKSPIYHTARLTIVIMLYVIAPVLILQLEVCTIRPPSSNSLSLYPPLRITTILISFSMIFFSFKKRSSTHKWDYTVFIFFLTYFT